MEKESTLEATIQATNEKSTPNESQDQVLMDFSSMFKGKKNVKRPIKPSKASEETKTPNWLLQIPAKLDICREDIQNRKVLNMKRWNCMTKADISANNNKNQELNLKMIAAAVSSWNYCYSTKGLGNNQFLTIKKALEIVKSKQSEILTSQISEFGRQKHLELICHSLSVATGKKISVHSIIKLTPPQQIKLDSNDQIQKLLSHLKDKDNQGFYIYLAHEQLFCPIGFEITPLKPLDAYSKLSDIKKQDQELWIICSCVGRCEQSFFIKRWSHIQQDLKAQRPEYLDIKQPKKGLQTLQIKDGQQCPKGNSNCILQIRGE